ncbi:hypothetical protein B0H14DRAFT_3112205 [Mycena olivaceomarginata]|nr:hypothetical protein B0H14DRAFT_3112205 [Mycena olivaceomarginata]
MWEDYRVNGADFSVGDDIEDQQKQCRRLQEEADVFGLWNPDATARLLGFGGEDARDQVQEDEDDLLAEIMRNVDGVQHEPATTSQNWFPYSSKTLFLLDTLDNLPRHHISSSLMRVFLWILQEAGCKDKRIRGQCGIPSIPCKSAQGNVFFMNDPRAIIANRKNMDLDMLSPMYAAGFSHYYVNEVARLRNGRFIVPMRWVTHKNKVWTDTFSVTFNEQATIMDDRTVFICAEYLKDNYYDLEYASQLPKWGAPTIESGYPTHMPNPKRVIAAGQPFYSSFVDYFSDDVSGNWSKSWNKHWNAYATHWNLPRHLLQQEFHVHFISTSPNATVSEQFCEFKQAVERVQGNTYQPVKVQDESGNAVCFAIYVNAGPSDNPMQRGYHALFEAGEPRTKELITTELKKQVKLAMHTQFTIDELLSRFKEMRKAEPTRPIEEIEAEPIQWMVDNEDRIYSPFLTMKGFDPTKDTPIELLHTILLRVVKYIWHVSHISWSPEQKADSTNTDGLSIHAIQANYIMQYAGSLIGRQFKTIAQTNLFHVRDLVTDDQFKAWRATGELAALLWFPEIRNLNEYRHNLKVAVANVLDIFGTIDPSKIIPKVKYHLLVHAGEDVFESFNTVFRHCSVLSNHLAPMLELQVLYIARQLADQEGLKHRLTGRWWSSSRDETSQRAGSGVRDFLEKHPVLQKLLGWTDPKLVKHGDIKVMPLTRGQKEKVTHLLHTTTAARAVNYGLYHPDESLDECFIGSWVFAQSPTAQVLSARDETYGVPVLVRRHSEVTFSIATTENIKFKLNTQHDCESAQCDTSRVHLRMQEHVESDHIENFVVHKPLDRFFINSLAFHNAHLLRATLPRDLLAPLPLFPDRQQKHHKLAAQLRDTRSTQLATRKAAEK